MLKAAGLFTCMILAFSMDNAPGLSLGSVLVPVILDVVTDAAVVDDVKDVVLVTVAMIDVGLVVVIVVVIVDETVVLVSSLGV